MKIAILFCGHLRSFRQTYPSFEQLRSLLEQLGEVDVFCHTWDIEESVTASWWKENESSIPPANVNEEEIRKLYTPVKISVEASKQFEDIPLAIKSIIPVSGILSMLYSQYRVFQLMDEWRKEKGTGYDIIIKTRYDLGFELATVFSQTLQTAADQQSLYLPNTNPYELCGAFADVFAVGAEKQMDEYCRFYERFRETVTGYEKMGYRELVPELCLRTYLDQYKINYHPLEGIRVHILRSNGDKFRICSDRNFENNEPLCFFRETISKNRNVLSDGSEKLRNNTEALITKYLLWLDKDLQKQEIDQYIKFYFGSWIPSASIKRLALLSKAGKILSPAVLKSFFEEAIRNSEYGLFRKILVAFIMYRNSLYGSFYFRVIKKMITEKQS